MTFWPGESTCTPAVTTSVPGATPPAITASLPSAVATCTGCDFTVIEPLSSTHTAVPPPSCRKALVGSLSTGAPLCDSACGRAYTVAPSGGELAASMLTFTV